MRESLTSLRVGVIGLGAVSDAHLAAYTDVAGIKVVAAAELRQDRLNEISSKHGLRPYSTYRGMLAQESLDIACVLAPVSLHCEITEDCARAGVHVFCEKPMAATLADAEKMVLACEQQSVKLFYGASYRFLPAIQKAREIIASGAVGDVMLITESVLGGSGASVYHPMPFVHYPKGGPGGSCMGLVDHGVHMIDLFPWLTGSEILSVSGRGNISGDPPATEYVLMTLSNGTVCQLLYNESTFDTDMPAEGIFSHGAAFNIGGYEPPDSWHAHPGYIRVYGTKGSMRIFHYANQLVLRDRDGQRQIPLAGRTPPAQFAMQLKSFSHSIREDTLPEVTGKDGIIALRALFAVYESHRLGRTIQMDDQIVTGTT